MKCITVLLFVAEDDLDPGFKDYSRTLASLELKG